jgi:hypothetical protein
MDVGHGFDVVVSLVLVSVGEKTFCFQLVS